MHFCGESRIRTCEVHTADLQSALVGRLSISPYEALDYTVESLNLIFLTVIYSVMINKLKKINSKLNFACEFL